ncbi:MAG: hypothetical protein R3255_02435 [Candidatus Lokiarchaeia archaeon]|nr:hypothetical protein [Candidatus Lokiarchaeia archaeon]
MKKKYDTIEMKNKAMRMIASKNNRGMEMMSNKTIFQTGYSIIFCLVAKESKKRNIKKVRYGKNIIIPIVGRNWIITTPTRSHITRVANLQFSFLKIFFKLSIISIKI